MIIIQIRGGLGNQFFTYAIAYALSKDLNTDIMIDKQLYQTFYKLRDFQLDDFQIDTSKVLMKKSYGHNRISCKIFNMIHDIKIKTIYHAIIIKEEEEFAFQKINVQKEDNIYLCDGYWQCYQYFDKYRNDLKQIFQLKNTKVLNSNKKMSIITDKNSVAVHIRRGDYKSFKGGKCLSFRYYENAMQKMRNLVGTCARFIVFTDDIEYCKKYFSKEKDVIFFSDIFHVTDVEEFYLMSKCSHFIIANSSFSWWAAYLGDGETKKVIAPVVDMWKKEFYLPEWNVIETELAK